MAAGKIYLSAILNELLAGIDGNLDELKTSMNGVKNSVDSVAVSVPAKIDQQIEELRKTQAVLSSNSGIVLSLGTDFNVEVLESKTFSAPSTPSTETTIFSIIAHFNGSATMHVKMSGTRGNGGICKMNMSVDGNKSTIWDFREGTGLGDWSLENEIVFNFSAGKIYTFSALGFNINQQITCSEIEMSYSFASAATNPFDLQ